MPDQAGMLRQMPARVRDRCRGVRHLPATKTKSLQTTAGTKPEVGAEATPGDEPCGSRIRFWQHPDQRFDIVCCRVKQRSITTDVLGGM